MSYVKTLEDVSPIPINLPRIYLLGDTGAGKTTIIRKILGTDSFNFPTTRQTRTTVAITEYIISKSLPFKATYIFKTVDQIKGYILEILHEAMYKAYTFKGKQEDQYKIAKYLKQTTDQRFRLYYIISEDFLFNICDQIFELVPLIENQIENLKKEFPDDEGEIETLFELSLENLKEDFEAIRDDVFSKIHKKVVQVCDGYDLNSQLSYYQYSNEQKETFIEKCKMILSSEKNSISPVIDYARIQGDLLADWINEDTEIVLIDGEGIGHDTKEASLLAPRHYEHFYKSDAIVLVEESKKPFVASGKSALRSIFERGYGDKLIVIFSKLDEVIPYDIDNPYREDIIDEVNNSLENVLSALKNEKVEILLKEDRLYYFSEVNQTVLNEETIDEFLSVINKAKELFDFKVNFIKPEYDFEMLSGYLTKSTERFINLYNEMLQREHWQTIKAFNRRMCWGIDGFRMFTPIADFEEKINEEIKLFISNPKNWNTEVTEKLKIESINHVKREFNQLILEFARQIMITKPTYNWYDAMSYYGSGSTFIRKRRIQEILNDAVPVDLSSIDAMDFKNLIKQILVEAIEKCENIA